MDGFEIYRVVQLVDVGIWRVEKWKYGFFGKSKWVPVRHKAGFRPSSEYFYNKEDAFRFREELEDMQKIEYLLRMDRWEVRSCGDSDKG